MEAETMISSCKTKIFLRASNARNAEWVADTIGKPEMEKHEESYSSHLWDGHRDSITQRKPKAPEHLILPNELQQLDDLHGYLLYKNYLVPIHVAIKDMVELNEID
jgi:type IV secretory pathway TraG/TraD family ATPase VirD4